jgi:5-dehydro-2-deoxygluconokinase
MIRRFKVLVGRALRDSASPAAGAIVDERYGDEALFALTGRGLWLGRPVEVPGSAPLEFEAGANIAAALRAWPAEHVVKCLFHYDRGDLGELAQLQDACIATGHELLLEILPRDVPRAMQEIYAAGIRPDWWKLSPPASDADWLAIEAVLAKHDPHCRGVLLLGMEASEASLEHGFALAARHPVCKGFAVGRSIFMDVARRWFKGECGDAAVVAEVAANYRRLAEAWKNARRNACRESVSSA